MSVLAYRAWAVGVVGGVGVVAGVAQLESLHQSLAWPVGTEPRFRCMYHSELHSAPERGCHCGFYAFRDLTIAEQRQGGPIRGSGFVLGAVACWGKLIVHEDGVRAEHCRVLGLFDEGESAPMLAERYRVPLLDPATVATDLRAYDDPEVWARAEHYKATHDGPWTWQNITVTGLGHDLPTTGWRLDEATYTARDGLVIRLQHP